MFPNMFDGLISALIIVGVISGVTITVGLYYLLPWIWSYLKPIIQVLVA